MIEETTDKATDIYWLREAVGVFSEPSALEAAVDQLELSGFDRASVSVLATDAKARDELGRFYRTARAVEDDGHVLRGSFVSSDALAGAEAAAIGFPLYIGGISGALAVVAAGGALGLAIAASIACGAAGAGLGAVLATTIERRHSDRIRQLLDKGGLVLWVAVSDPDAEKRAIAILIEMGGHDVHIHEIQREWSISDIPLAESQPDPFLERKRQ